MYGAVQFIENRLKVDDPVGAIAVHGVNGIFGVLAVGLFGNGAYGIGWNLTTRGDAAEATGITGIFGGSEMFSSLGFQQLAAQTIGAVTLCTVMFGLAFAFFKIQNALTTGGIRSDEEDELAGLDLPEMGVLAYPDFVGSHTVHGTTPFSGSGVEDPVPAEV
jgi:Amt family ammonium transporter